MLGSWLTSIVHAAAPVAEVAATAMGQPEIAAAIAAGEAQHNKSGGGGGSVAAPVVLVANPQNEFLLLAAAGLGVLLLFQKPRAAPAIAGVK